MRIHLWQKHGTRIATGLTWVSFSYGVREEKPHLVASNSLGREPRSEGSTLRLLLPALGLRERLMGSPLVSKAPCRFMLCTVHIYIYIHIYSFMYIYISAYIYITYIDPKD